MKKIFGVFVAAVLFAAPYAQAQTCSGGSCNYIDAAGNNHFGSGLTGWTTGGASVANPGNCHSSAMGELSPGDYLSRTFDVVGDFSSYKVTFRAWLVNDADNYYDQLKVRVTNNATGAYEEMAINGLSYTNQCDPITFNLSNQYDNTNVTVKFYTGNFTIRTWQIDDVSFFAYY